MSPASNERRISRHLKACSAMAGAMLLPLAAPPAAHADIFTTGTTFTITGPSYYTVFFQMGTAASPTAKMVLAPVGTTAVAGFAGAYSSYEFAIQVGPGSTTELFGNFGDGYSFYHSAVLSMFDYDALAKFSYGSTITGYFDPQTSPTDEGFTFPPYGGWIVGGGSGYVGFKITKGGLSYYGWIGLELLSTGPTSSTVGGFGWEGTAGTSITAGAVPEPGAMSLAGLALGAIGVAAWRKRRREQDAA